MVQKKGKIGIVDQDIIPMIRDFDVTAGEKELRIELLACCQNPTLNPMQIVTAVETYLPELKPNHARCRRIELYDAAEKIFR